MNQEEVEKNLEYISAVKRRIAEEDREYLERQFTERRQAIEEARSANHEGSPYHPKGFLDYLNNTLSREVVLGNPLCDDPLVMPESPNIQNLRVSFPIFASNFTVYRDSAVEPNEMREGYGLIGRYSLIFENYFKSSQNAPTLVYYGIDPTEDQVPNRISEMSITVRDENGVLKLIENYASDLTVRAFPGLVGRSCNIRKTFNNGNPFGDYTGGEVDMRTGEKLVWYELGNVGVEEFRSKRGLELLTPKQREYFTCVAEDKYASWRF